MTSSLPSLGAQLDSARAKLRRADQQLRALKQSLDRFGNRQPYRVWAHGYNPRDSGVVLHSRIEIHRITEVAGVKLATPIDITRTLIRDLPIAITAMLLKDFSAQYVRWGLSVGEIVHNISAALDNLIWELSQPYIPPEPLTTASSKIRAEYKRKINSVGFPYTKLRRDWPNSCGRHLVFLPDDAVRTVLERFQAFHAWENDGTDTESFSLELLHELWNRDKHRTINLGVAGASASGWAIRSKRFPSAGDLPSQLVELFPLRPIEAEAEIARLIVQLPQEVALSSDGSPLDTQMEVQASLTLAILFGQGSPGEGLQAIAKLREAYNLAVKAVNEFT